MTAIRSECACKPLTRTCAGDVSRPNDGDAGAVGHVADEAIADERAKPDSFQSLSREVPAQHEVPRTPPEAKLARCLSRRLSSSVPPAEPFTELARHLRRRLRAPRGGCACRVRLPVCRPRGPLGHRWAAGSCVGTGAEREGGHGDARAARALQHAASTRSSQTQTKVPGLTTRGLSGSNQVTPRQPPS